VLLKHPWAAPDSKLAWLKNILAIALISGFALSWRLWISSRRFPLSPVFGALPSVPFPLDIVWLVLLLGLLLAIVPLPHPRKLLFIFLVLAGLLALWDQTRWQPWFYQYYFMLLAISFYAWKPAATRDTTAINCCRVIVAFTYFWSGLQKLNLNFVRETWPDIAGPFLRFLPLAGARLPRVLILIIPVTEILISLGLVTRRYRNLTVKLAIATHVFVLAILLSSGENTVVWPWNIAMALFVAILFWQDRETTASRILLPSGPLPAMIVLLFAALPALSLVELWDSYLSSALYSGNTDQGVIILTPSVVDRLPVTIHPYIWQRTPPFFLDINRWAYGELNTPLYPEPRIYRNVAAQVCNYRETNADITLLIRHKPHLLTGSRKSEFFDCDHLH